MIKSLVFLSLLVSTAAFADFKPQLLVKCTEVAPQSDRRPYRYNARIYRYDDRRFWLTIHKVNQANNIGARSAEDLVSSQRVSTNPETIVFWNASQTLILKDVRPYHSNLSILDIKGLPHSFYMKCFHVNPRP